MGRERVGVVAARFDVYLIRLDPTEGANSKDAPVPRRLARRDEAQHRNHHCCTHDQQGTPYPTRVGVRFRRKAGQIVLDQIRTVDSRDW
jgi:mRNA interferase MazF